MNYNVPQAFLFPFPFDRKMVSGDIKSHFELTSVITKEKLAKMQKSANTASFIPHFNNTTELSISMSYLYKFNLFFYN